MVESIPSFNLKRATIEPFIIPQEIQDEVKALLESARFPDVNKKTVLRRVGACVMCGQMAEKIAKYRKYGMVIIEKYCDECLERFSLD